MTRENWGDWSWVGTESEFLQALADGLISSTSFTAKGHAIGDPAAYITLIRGRRAVEVFGTTVDSRLETGRPVAVRWRASVIQPLLDRHGVPGSVDEIRVHGCLPLARDVFRLELESRDRMVVLEAFDELGWVSARSIRHVGVFGEAATDVVTGESEPPPQLRLDLRDHDVVRVSRLQCAIELCAAIPANRSDVVRRLVVADAPESSDVEIVWDMLSVRSGGAASGRSSIGVAAEFLLRRDPRLRFGPLPITEKSDFLEDVRRSTNEGSLRRNWVDEILHRVRSDEPIGSMDVGALDVDLQALVLFLLYGDSPSRIAELDAGYVSEQFGITNGLAHLAAAFLTGLRFVRSMLPAERSFPVLRDLHVLDLASLVNGVPFDLAESAHAEIANDVLVMSGEALVPRSSALAIKFPKPVQATCLRNGDARLVTFDQLVLQRRENLVAYKSVKSLRPMEGSEKTLCSHLRFSPVRGILTIKPTDQDAVNSLLIEFREGELRFDGTVWLFDGDLCSLLEGPTLQIAEAELLGCLVRSQGNRADGRRSTRGDREPGKVTKKALHDAMVEVRMRLPATGTTASLPL